MYTHQPHAQNTDRAERSRKDAIAQVAIWKAQDVARQVISFCDDIKDQAERAERKAEKLYVVFERGIRAWSSRMSLLFHVSVMPLKLQEYHSYRSLILQENHPKKRF